MCSVSNRIKYLKLYVHWIRETPGPTGCGGSRGPALGQGAAEGKEEAQGQPSVPDSFSRFGKVNRVKLPKSPGSAFVTLCFIDEETEVPGGTGKVSEPTFRPRWI